MLESDILIRVTCLPGWVAHHLGHVEKAKKDVPVGRESPTHAEMRQERRAPDYEEWFLSYTYVSGHCLMIWRAGWV